MMRKEALVEFEKEMDVVNFLRRQLKFANFIEATCDNLKNSISSRNQNDLDQTAPENKSKEE